MKENIVYTGIVNSSKKTKRGKVVAYKLHNSATPRLFKGLCYALIGNSIGQYIPCYIDCVKETPGSTLESILEEKSKVVGTFFEVVGIGSTTPTARFVSQISAYQIKSGQQAGDTYYLALLDNRVDGDVNDRILAKVSINYEDINLGVGTVLSIEWDMTFESSSVSQQEQQEE